MKSSPLTLVCCVLLSGGYLLELRADDRVVVVANADERYTEQKFGGAEPKRETYVFMQGRYYGGSTVDRSLERMSIREVVSYLAPKLAEQQFVPAKDTGSTDLLLVVHWGVTNPRVGRLEMMGRTNTFTPTTPVAVDSSAPPEEQENTEALNGLLGAQDRSENLEIINDSAVMEQSDRDLAQLLGYNDVLRRFGTGMMTSTYEQTLRSDLQRERYFIIVRAYDLRAAAPSGPPRPVWTMNLNVSSPGNNFRTAMTRMSHVAPTFAGRSTRDVESVRASAPNVKVELGDLIIVGAAP